MLEWTHVRCRRRRRWVVLCALVTTRPVMGRQILSGRRQCKRDAHALTAESCEHHDDDAANVDADRDSTRGFVAHAARKPRRKQTYEERSKNAGYGAKRASRSPLRGGTLPGRAYGT